MVKAKLIGAYPKDRTIAEMKAGESAYTVPWAYNPRTEDLDYSYIINPEKLGTAHMRVDCIMPGVYRVQVEKPKYRSLADCLREA